MSFFVKKKRGREKRGRGLEKEEMKKAKKNNEEREL
jgi:hypothetical protein